jgi:hypothetical protein
MMFAFASVSDIFINSLFLVEKCTFCISFVSFRSN